MHCRFTKAKRSPCVATWMTVLVVAFRSSGAS